MPTARSLVEEHLDAFNAHDSARLLATLSPGIEWVTGQDAYRGQAEVAELFDPSLWDLDPSLTAIRLVADDVTVAAELVERLTVGGDRREFTIAAFFDVQDGLIARARVYREGVADIE